MTTHNGKQSLLFFLGIALENFQRPDMTEDEIFERWEKFVSERSLRPFDHHQYSGYGYRTF